MTPHTYPVWKPWVTGKKTYLVNKTDKAFQDSGLESLPSKHMVWPKQFSGGHHVFIEVSRKDRKKKGFGESFLDLILAYKTFCFSFNYVQCCFSMYVLHKDALGSTWPTSLVPSSRQSHLLPNREDWREAGSPPTSCLFEESILIESLSPYVDLYQ